jgi:FkbM family methyltransferase
MNVVRRAGFARERSASIRPIRRGPISAFLFFFLAGAGRPWRFHLGPLAFYARYRDWVAVEEIALHDEYGFVNGVLDGKHAPRVVDLGAHIGLFSLFVLRSFPSAIIHSVEASRDTYDILRLNSTINERPAWHVHWAAMWSQDGEVPFVDDQKASTGHHVALSGSPAPARVPALSLATLLRERVGSDVDLLKVDIEGAEEAVLCEEPALLQSVEAVTAELHPDRCDQQRVLRLFREAYDYVYTVKGRGSSKPLVIAARRPVNDPSLALL